MRRRFAGRGARAAPRGWGSVATLAPMPPTITWPQALAWRMRRQLLDPISGLPVTAVVDRLCGVQAQVASSAELAVRVRRTTSKPGEVAAALADGRLIKTWAMRGTLHLVTPEHGGAFLALMAAGRPWARPSWQRYFGLTPAVLEELRDAAAEALDGRTLTREELIEAVTARRSLAPIADGLRSGWGTLLKPLAWQGDLCFGPSRGTRVTFMRPKDASTRWAGLPEPEAAATTAIAAYLGAYGPASAEAFSGWLSRGWFGKRQLHAWFRALGDRLAEIDVEGNRLYLLAEHLDDLLATSPTKAVRLLPGFDQYVLGPGTDDGHVLATARRSAVSRQSGWIAPVVVARGAVAGTWELDGDLVQVAWFHEAGRPPRKALGGEVARLSTIFGRDFGLEVSDALPA